MARRLGPCSQYEGEWLDGGATSFSGTLTCSNWRLTGSAQTLSSYTTPTLHRGAYWFFYAVISPATWTMYSHNPVSGGGPVPTVRPTTAFLYTDYPDYNYITGLLPDHHVGAVFVPYFVSWTGYDAGALIDDGSDNAHATWTARTAPVLNDTLTYSCVAQLVKSESVCCYYPGLCDYSSGELASFGITESSPRTLTFVVANGEPVGTTNPDGSASGADSSYWSSINMPTSTTLEISGYLGDPPP